MILFVFFSFCLFFSVLFHFLAAAEGEVKQHLHLFFVMFTCLLETRNGGQTSYGKSMSVEWAVGESLITLLSNGMTVKGT